jgi:hypothetical protein
MDATTATERMIAALEANTAALLRLELVSDLLDKSGWS